MLGYSPQITGRRLMTVDPAFGPVLMFGLGGIFVEVLKDVAFRVAPVVPNEVTEMLSEIRGIIIPINSHEQLKEH